MPDAYIAHMSPRRDLLIPVADALPAVQVVLRRYGQHIPFPMGECEVSALLERRVQMSELVVRLATTLNGKPAAN